MIRNFLTNLMTQCEVMVSRMKSLFSFRGFALTLGVTALISSGLVFAAANDTVTIQSIQTNIASATQTVGKILVDIALLAGIGFVLASLFKFHQHKLNPTQVPISQGVTLLLVGAALLVFPALLSTTTKAVFNKDAGADPNDITKILKSDSPAGGGGAAGAAQQ